MAGIHFMGKVPFHTVYFNPLVKDVHGKKMSKSWGNVIDPLEVIDKAGADALRFAFLSLLSGQGQDVKLSEDKITEARNFANKIWNVARFVEMNRSPVQNPKLQIRTELELADKWILSRLNNTIKKVTEEIDHYQFGEAAHALYDFIWSEFCDWYIEIAKIRLYGQDDKAKLTVQAVLLTTLDGILKLLHPFMPFITEEIHSRITCLPAGTAHYGLRITKKDSIMYQTWPKADKKAIDLKAEAEMDTMMGIVRAVRNIRAEFNVPHGKEIDVVIVTGGSINEAYLKSLAKVGKLTFARELKEKPKQSASAVVEKSQVFVLLAGLIDPEKETGRLKKDAEKLEIELTKIRGRLNDQNFLTRALPESVQKEKEKELEFAAKVKIIEERLRDLS